jgi:hypothetical protein
MNYCLPLVSPSTGVGKEAMISQPLHTVSAARSPSLSKLEQDSEEKSDQNIGYGGKASIVKGV